MKIALKSIALNPDQPRKTLGDDELRELADSIEQHGLLQPVLVEEIDGHYVLIAGERRLRAHELLNLPAIEAVVIPATNHNGRERLVYALIENLQREEMRPVDTARALKRLMVEQELSIKDLARMIGKSVYYVRSHTDLLRYDEEIQSLVNSGELSKNANLAVKIAQIPNRELRIKLARKIANKRLTERGALLAADRVLRAITAPKLSEVSSPALEIARRKNGMEQLDEQHEPAKWNVLSGIDQLPKWDLFTKKALEMCDACILRSTANEQTCGDCPAAEFITMLVGAAK